LVHYHLSKEVGYVLDYQLGPHVEVLKGFDCVEQKQYYHGYECYYEHYSTELDGQIVSTIDLETDQDHHY